MGETKKTLPRLLARKTEAIAWTLAVTTVVLAVIAWGASNHWQFAGLSTYRWFPLFGLLAFSLFWSQYVMAAISIYAKTEANGLRGFYKITNMGVLVALLLHPGLLSYQLWLDGYGLPPMSILQHAVLPGFEWIVLLGMTSWAVFMFYLLSTKAHSYFATKKWWRWFGYLGELAMFAVFYHGLRLGDQLEAGWYQIIWLGYGLVLLAVVVYLHRHQLLRMRSVPVKG